MRPYGPDPSTSWTAACYPGRVYKARVTRASDVRGDGPKVDYQTDQTPRESVVVDGRRNGARCTHLAHVVVHVSEVARSPQHQAGMFVCGVTARSYPSTRDRFDHAHLTRQLRMRGCVVCKRTNVAAVKSPTLPHRRGATSSPRSAACALRSSARRSAGRSCAGRRQGASVAASRRRGRRGSACARRAGRGAPRWSRSASSAVGTRAGRAARCASASPRGARRRRRSGVPASAG